MVGPESAAESIDAQIGTRSARLLSELECDRAELSAENPLSKVQHLDEGRAAVDSAIEAVRRLRRAIEG